MVSKNNEKKKYISDDNKKLYSILFQWEGEAEKVYLTGSFCNWINFYEMQKIKNKFFFTLFLQKGTYQYKFKVDSVWKCNDNYPTCSDQHGNINNYIEVTNRKLEEMTSDFSTSSISDYQEDNSENSLYEFSNIFNKSEDNINIKLNKDDVNNNKESIRNNLSNPKNFFEEKEDINSSSNNPYHKIMPINDEITNHLNITKEK